MVPQRTQAGAESVPLVPRWLYAADLLRPAHKSGGAAAGQPIGAGRSYYTQFRAHSAVEESKAVTFAKARPASKGVGPLSIF